MADEVMVWLPQSVLSGLPGLPEPQHRLMRLILADTGPRSEPTPHKPVQFSWTVELVSYYAEMIQMSTAETQQALDRLIRRKRLQRREKAGRIQYRVAYGWAPGIRKGE